MFKSYFKTGWRNLTRNKGYSFINITGLALGMSVAIVIGLWTADEFSFDQSFKNHERIAAVMLRQTISDHTYVGTVIAPPVAEPLRTQFASDIKASALVSLADEHILGAGEKKVSNAGSWVQKEFPEMFTLSMQAGQSDALKDPSTVLISISLAKTLFGQENAMNRNIRIDNRFDMRVGGIFRDFDVNSSFSGIAFLLPWDSKENYLNTITDWDNHSCTMYLQLQDRTDIRLLSERVRYLPTPHFKDWHEEILLYALDRLHLYGSFENGVEGSGRITFVWLIGTIGGFVLLLAFINFMNLATARSEKRAKEVGIRKTIGSHRNQLVGQFLVESIIVAMLALVASLIFVHLTLPFFDSIAGKQIRIDWSNPSFWLLVTGFTLFSGIIAGSYPAFYLSSFKPIKVLKGSFKAGRFASLPRKVLVVLQFTVSLTLIIGTVIVFRQIEFAKNRPVGYSRNGLLVMPMKTPDLQGHYDLIRNALLKTGTVENMAESSVTVTGFNNNNSVDWPGKDKTNEIFFRDINITADFGKTIGWKVTAGRDFSSDIVGDSSSVLVNQAAVDIMPFKNPVGERVTYFGKEFTIIGVSENMVTRNPYAPIEPAIFFLGKWLNVITIRVTPGTTMQNALAKIEPVFKQYNPNAPFEYRFVDDDYARKFQSEQQMGNLAGMFAILAIAISCLGIFGLASFVAEQRSKEIGIRKVMGASVGSVWQLLSSDFVKLVMLSCLIAIPIAYYYFSGWLRQYSYRAELSWWIFAASAIGAIIVTLVTVSFQAIRAAMANPVNSLRSE